MKFKLHSHFNNSMLWLFHNWNMKSSITDSMLFPFLLTNNWKQFYVHAKIPSYASLRNWYFCSIVRLCVSQMLGKIKFECSEPKICVVSVNAQSVQLCFILMLSEKSFLSWTYVCELFLVKSQKYLSNYTCTAWIQIHLDGDTSGITALWVWNTDKGEHLKPNS